MLVARAVLSWAHGSPDPEGTPPRLLPATVVVKAQPGASVCFLTSMCGRLRGPLRGVARLCPQGGGRLEPSFKGMSPPPV